MSIFGDLAQGAVGLYGYNDLQDNLSETQGKLNTAVEGLQQGVDDRLGFQGYGVTSAYGDVNSTQNGLEYNLSPEQQAYMQQQGQGASSLFESATQDPTARQQDFYNQMQQARQPQLQQAYGQLQQGTYGQGTGGMQTASFGGNPEQYAFGKALADSQQSDMIGSYDMAMKEQAQQAAIGQQMFQNQYTPQDMLNQNAGIAANQQQINNDMARQNASLWTELGLGSLATNANYDSIKANALGDQYRAGASVAGGLGDMIPTTSEGWGDLWDGLTGWFD